MEERYTGEEYNPDNIGEGENEEENKPSRMAEVISWIKVIVSAVIIAVLVDMFVIANASVPTGSMEDTIPTNARIVGLRLAYNFAEPQRGDIAIFKYPDDRTTDYVKRIIGLPGETVEVIDGKVYIDGSDTPLDEPYIKDIATGDFGPYHVPENSYFMMGDNRESSWDSRYWDNTYVERSEIIAKVYFMYFPAIRGLGHTYEIEP